MEKRLVVLTADSTAWPRLNIYSCTVAIEIQSAWHIIPKAHLEIARIIHFKHILFTCSLRTGHKTNREDLQRL